MTVDGDALAVGDDRVVALEDDDGVGLGGGFAGGGEAVLADRGALALEQAAELAGVRGEDGRGRSRGEPAEIAGEGVEAVGVDHQRRLDPGGRRRGPARRCRRRGRGRGRARRRRPARRRRAPLRPSRGRGTRRRPGSRATSPPAGRTRRSARGRRGRRRSRSRRRRGSPPCEDICTAPVSPREPPAIVTWPEENLVDWAPRLGARSRTAASIVPASGREGAAGGIPIGATRNSPVLHFPGAIRCPTLAAWKLTVTSAATAAPAISPVDASTPEAMSQATTGAPHPLIASIAFHAGSRGAPENPVPKIASTTAPEPASRASRSPLAVATTPASTRPRFGAGVIAQLVGAPEQQHLDREPHLPQQPRRNQPVAAVVALPADDPHRPVARKLRDSLRNGPPGVLHQLQRRHPLLIDRPSIHRPHTFRVIKGLEPALHRPSVISRGGVGVASERFAPPARRPSRSSAGDPASRRERRYTHATRPSPTSAVAAPRP